MAFRKYRVDAVDRQGRRSERDRVRCTLTRLDDGRVIVVNIACMKDVGQVVTLDDDQVYFSLWQP
jgi:hypothetical protein